MQLVGGGGESTIAQFKLDDEAEGNGATRRFYWLVVLEAKRWTRRLREAKQLVASVIVFENDAAEVGVMMVSHWSSDMRSLPAEPLLGKARIPDCRLPKRNWCF